MSKQICFCFGYTESDLKQDVIEHGKSLIMKRSWRRKRLVDANVKQRIPKVADVLQMFARW